jgi:hypothetical protein
MIKGLLFSILILILSFCFVKRFRYYCLSYVFSDLYNNERVANLLGIQFDDVFKYEGSRKFSRIYSDGVFVKILELITGMNLRVSDKTRFELIRLQREHSREINMEKYLDQLDGKKMTALEFEYFISKVLLIETNRIYNVFDQEKLDVLIKYSIVVFETLNALSGGMIDGFYYMFKNIRPLYEISKVLKSAPEAKRLIVFGPELSLVTNYTKMLMRNKNFDLLNTWNFLDLQTAFFVLEEYHDNFKNHKLVFLKRSTDHSNGMQNKAFGPKFVACPGNRITIDYINSILNFFQKFEVIIEGDAVWEGVRFRNIVNKRNIHFSFKRKDKIIEHKENEIIEHKENEIIEHDKNDIVKHNKNEIGEYNKKEN